ncbi:MAG: OmpH family outer membrane protein [Spirochaetaceae bacterium]|jgi:outer membrane protein|nr:OmpH family outer membrane protein [Spirochaetaceae bacterium]
MKKLILSQICLMIFPVLLSAQQITRFAVVDMSKVYTAFFRESRAVRDFEERSARVQADVDRMTREIQDLKSSQSNAELQGDNEKAVKLESEIYKKSEFLKEYFKLKTTELEDQKKKLSQSSAFLEQVYNELRLVAESEGYSMVLNLKDVKGILWYSPAIDITDKVIQNLQSKGGR